jgi:hypothetical protein
VLHLPKSVIQKEKFNSNAHATKNYNILEYLAQDPCAMSTLEVIWNCSSQHRTMFSTIEAMDPKESNLITFNLDYFKEILPHHLAFQIQILVGGKNIHRTFLDEGASTYVMSLPCWRALGSPKLSQYPTTLKVFDGHGFQPQGILQYFSMTLKGKTILVNIKLVDAPLDYNLLLGHSWFYVMNIITSSVFRILGFPHQKKIITIDQFDYTTPYLHNVAVNNVPFLE